MFEEWTRLDWAIAWFTSVAFVFAATLVLTIVFLKGNHSLSE